MARLTSPTELFGFFGNFKQPTNALANKLGFSNRILVFFRVASPDLMDWTLWIVLLPQTEFLGTLRERPRIERLLKIRKLETGRGEKQLMDLDV